MIKFHNVRLCHQTNLLIMNNKTTNQVLDLSPVIYLTIMITIFVVAL